MGREGQAPGATGEQGAEFTAGRTGPGRERNPRKERGAGGADVRVGRDELLFGLANIGAAHEQIGRQAGGQLGQAPLRQARAHELIAHLKGQRLTQQQHQRVLIERTLALLLRQRDARAFEQGLRQAGLQFGSRAVFEAQLHELERIFARGQRLLRDRQQFLVREQAEPGLRDRGNQADPRGLAALLRGEVLRQRLLLEAGHATEEIDLVGGHQQAGAVGGVAASRTCGRA